MKRLKRFLQNVNMGFKTYFLITSIVACRLFPLKTMIIKFHNYFCGSLSHSFNEHNTITQRRVINLLVCTNRTNLNIAISVRLDIH